MSEILFLGIICFFGNALYILGISTVTYYEETDDSSKMVFWRFRRWSIKTFGLFWSKPICVCPPCMSSLHSTYIYFPVAIWLFGTTLAVFLFWPVWALALAGFVKLING